ncbi:MAG: sigma-70 family RNA polymerase sigma factor [Eubacteriales bacterium]|nr:sigma-70 family RNA polymerase sigma factor [Eubacteriales bacterium]
MSKDNDMADDSILSNAQSGNQKVTETLIKQYTSLVEAVASKYTSSPMEYDDLVQEGMIGLLAAIKSYDESRGAGFKTYASVCIDNSIQTALRKFYRQKDIPMQNFVEYQEEEISQHRVSISAEDAYIAGESVSLLSKVLRENLSDFENEVLRLHIVGCSYNEIAKRLSKTPKAIDNAIQRIRRKLSSKSF